MLWEMRANHLNFPRKQLIPKFNRSSKNRSRNGRGRSTALLLRGNLSTYPSYNSQFILPIHLKYECSTASIGTTIYSKALLLALAMGNGSNGLLSIIQAARIKRIEIRGISSSVNKITTVNFAWQGSNDSRREITASGNTEKPLTLVTSPSIRSNTSFWKPVANTESLFILGTDADFGEAQLDLYFEIVLLDNGVTNVQASLSSAGTNGALYTTALDNTTDGSTWNTTPRWIPVSRNTIA